MHADRCMPHCPLPRMWVLSTVQAQAPTWPVCDNRQKKESQCNIVVVQAGASEPKCMQDMLLGFGFLPDDGGGGKHAAGSWLSSRWLTSGWLTSCWLTSCWLTSRLSPSQYETPLNARDFPVVAAEH